MAYQMAQIPMTLSELTTDIAHHGVPLHLQCFLLYWRCKQ